VCEYTVGTKLHHYRQGVVARRRRQHVSESDDSSVGDDDDKNVHDMYTCYQRNNRKLITLDDILVKFPVTVDAAAAGASAATASTRQCVVC
jgi:hypothetical protein